ncbi:uncharacterized protein LOC124553768 isoform X1 [Schistocerca americana]|uniref:uncharacterized protein LOC124553768 isoform X1 n=2 Tax=Schistocerca americana TaxID=7009 RepID=UPI001F503FF4|nr:uncharacterized protein LOC124553768 isoform X1 [Schistocerca americana]XP_046983661.1 uncharacterized protein LOC124553768 isoform X1 [Schistocerca americana]XP_047101293.1 uncharacterized protein LOC124720070 isoform X1 [Schistocerca piceifrons]XP_049944965.1 uncharacterized protein LOC126426907 isoform X1 [Schistocerca serialis cubense]XP_049944966.1 uncharacterized protein LOC126426907 isoform X1 [Schistocerca serialis cubense]
MKRKTSKRLKTKPKNTSVATPTVYRNNRKPKEMASTPSAGIHNLPYDVMFSIFCYLPIPDLAHCAAVSKQWHEIVSGFTHLWKGKRYVSNRSPKESFETFAILRALPLLQEVIIKAAAEFVIDIFYPRLVLLVTDISDIASAEDGHRLRCAYLSTRLDIAESIFSSRSIIDFAALQKLRIFKAIPTLDAFARKRDREVCCCASSSSSADYAVGTALELCPNLTDLCVYAEFLSADYLDASEGIGRLRTLEIECPGLEELAFLRHCSDALEELELKGCADLPSAAYANLRHLGNLQRLRLRDCCVAGGDLEVAATGLKSLVSLQLECCDLVSDVSFLRHCGRLRELRVEASPPDTLLTGLRHLPAGVRSLYLAGSAANAYELAVVLPRLPLLEELDLVGSDLPHLGFLRHCPQLRRLCLEFSHWPGTSELSNLRHLTRLEALDLTRCRVDADVLSGVMPSLSRLETLSLSHTEDVAHLWFLRHCTQLRTLSLFYTFGMDLDAYRELSHLTNLQTVHVSEHVVDFVREFIQPRMPQVKIYSVQQFK